MKRLIATLFTLLLLAGCAGIEPDVQIPDQPPTPLGLSSQPRVALVLGGGGARGYAHVGVLKVLTEAHLPIDIVAGTSVGSIVGALYADNGSYAEVYDAMQTAHFWDFFDISNVPNLKGMVQGYHIQKFLLAHLRSHDFSQMKIKFLLATTDLATGEVYPISSGPIAPAVRASISMPGIIQPMQMYGKTLIDGGMSDPVPVDLVKPFHPKLIIAVDIARPLSKEMPTTASDIAQRAMLISRLRITAASLEGADIVITPEVGDASEFDFKDKDRLIKAGETAATAALPQIKALMQQKGIPPYSS